MNPDSAATVVAADACPLCHRPNHCQLCTSASHKGQCWCFKIQVPEELLARVPTDLRNRACICRDCVTAFHRQNAKPIALRPGDFYFDKGMMVFREAYHLRRGYCCGSGCRHCPYPQ